MSGQPLKRRGVLIAAFVALDDPHFCRLSDDGNVGTNANFLE